MKTILLVPVLFLILCFAMAAPAADAPADKEYPQKVNVPHALYRGTANVFTGWLEIPRRMILKINDSPAFGYITGSMEGAFLASCRLVLSFFDFAMLGTTGPSAYNPAEFPEFVWDAQWNPYPEEIEPVEPEKPAEEEEKPKYQFITSPDDLI